MVEIFLGMTGKQLQCMVDLVNLSRHPTFRNTLRAFNCVLEHLFPQNVSVVS